MWFLTLLASGSPLCKTREGVLASWKGSPCSLTHHTMREGVWWAVIGLGWPRVS